METSEITKLIKTTILRQIFHFFFYGDLVSIYKYYRGL